ncbi:MULTISPECIES: peptidoglycan DD-metalloendopeptidase family protein [Marinobacter]|uniref:Peptidoglycan DD-metalloendopeptidase family protein n=1 Tax=Marinobacter suaedae TaxID=3057675 RepID=A0ABT8W0T5_9GAMM|nr:MULTISPECIES: peptidoglycan DD-metalloendopeptidase family protein [unclassified Marinobacter]MBZ2169878.1 peptidoglycan DD-metalloendopeptidase family protein [Marinobacter sp. F4216]MDO3721858.1 peptidoglycan DD-metalloendopeptidase family protein [Marinobacter sp. chi1]
MAANGAVLAGLFCVLMLSGCNTPALYKDDLYNPPVYWGQHVVRPGETLYSIAWRYGRDYRELGSANGIREPWTLKAGQVLRLDRTGTITASRPAASTASRPAQAPTRPRVAPPQAAPKTAPKPKVTKPPKKTAPLVSQSQTVGRIDWRWPHVGTVLAGYSSSGKVNKGLDIAGKPGDAVKAAANGNVVYAGNGLLGYGNLIIVNHNEHFLSAYAHNRKILVREGEDVKAGQVIAELGSSGAERPMLHFEIRKNGNPVDPAHYLPPRQ